MAHPQVRSIVALVPLPGRIRPTQSREKARTGKILLGLVLGGLLVPLRAPGIPTTGRSGATRTCKLPDGDCSAAGDNDLGRRVHPVCPVAIFIRRLCSRAGLHRQPEWQIQAFPLRDAAGSYFRMENEQVARRSRALLVGARQPGRGQADGTDIIRPSRSRLLRHSGPLSARAAGMRSAAESWLTATRKSSSEFCLAISAWSPPA